MSLLRTIARYCAKNKLLVTVFVLALLFRTVVLDSVPYSFHEDEMSNAYIGKFILLNGTDPHGQVLPLIYSNKFDDFPPVLPMYLSGISVLILGMSKFAARFPIALIGALSVFPVYYLSYELFKHKRAALFAGVVLALMPWHVVFSRTTAEGILALYVFMYGILYLFTWSRTLKRVDYLWSASLLLLTYFLYPSFRVLVPLFVGLALVTYRSKAKMLKPLIALMAVSVLLTGYIATTKWGQARFEQTSLFANEERREQLVQNITAQSHGVGEDNVMMARIFHNKPVAYAREYIREYLGYYSPIPLHLNGGHPYRYYPLNEQGFLYISYFFLTIAGMIYAGKKTDIQKLTIVGGTYFLAAAPAALTVDFTPHFHRAVVMMLPVALFAGYALHLAFIQKIAKIALLGIGLLLILSLETTYFVQQYVVHSGSFQPLFRNDQYEEVTQYVIDEKDNYDKIIMPGIEKLPLYYLYKTNNFDRSLTNTFKDNFYTESIDTIEYINNWCPSREVGDRLLESGETILVIDQGGCITHPGFYSIGNLTRADSTRAFDFLVPNIEKEPTPTSEE